MITTILRFSKQGPGRRSRIQLSADSRFRARHRNRRSWSLAASLQPIVGLLIFAVRQRGARSGGRRPAPHSFSLSAPRGGEGNFAAPIRDHAGRQGRLWMAQHDCGADRRSLRLGGRRIYAIGLVNGIEITVISTDRDPDERHIISAWRSEPHERRYYWNHHLED
jgi:hypothetical protein